MIWREADGPVPMRGHRSLGGGSARSVSGHTSAGQVAGSARLAGYDCVDQVSVRSDRADKTAHTNFRLSQAGRNG